MVLNKYQVKDIQRAFEKINRNELARMLVKSEKRNYIDQVATGKKLVSAWRAILIEKFTQGRIKREILRPDIFGKA
jgi:DNA-binding transcriptional regulator YdaS (Cro superfamily)